jgi:hypothetical protein
MSTNRTTKIHCPRCAWAPGAHDRWECRPGCGTVWNTFETRGRCPGCAKRWLVTTCLACVVTSLHERWYHDEADDAWQDAESGELVETGAGADPATGPTPAPGGAS